MNIALWVAQGFAALVFFVTGGLKVATPNFDPRRFTLEEGPVPARGPGEVLVAVKAAGVCLSDVHLIDGNLSSPFNRNPAVTLGHEVAGAIESL